MPDVLSTTLLNAANEQQRLVSGLKDTLALPLGSRGEVVSRVVVELMLDALGTASTHILRTGWLPHSSSACSPRSSSRCTTSPKTRFRPRTLSTRSMTRSRTWPSSRTTVALTVAHAGLVLLALTASGLLLSQPLWPADQANGQLILTHVVPTPPELRGRAGASLHYSALTSLLFTVYADGRCFGLRLDESGTEVLGGFVVPSTRVDYMPSGALGGIKSTCSPYSHWQDVPDSCGLLDENVALPQDAAADGAARDAVGGRGAGTQALCQG